MVSIREAQREDCAEIMALIKELAVFEKAEKEVSNSIEQLEKDGFGQNPIWKALLSEWEGRVVGMSLYYFRYSTWKGKRLYLEDLIVTNDYRGKGIGKALLDATQQVAKETGCTGMMWQVLDWNKPAINFYEEYGATIDKEWYNCHLNF